MTCYWPLKAYVGQEKEKGKINVVGKRRQSWKGEELFLPCGQCIGCRLERSRQWAARCINEASLYDENCFLTLTYNEENLPKNGSLVLDDFQLFIKRLRKRVGKKIRYFHCGEYGEKLSRPHYHCLLFNFDFDDKEIFKVLDGMRLYTSKTLEDLWKKGFCTIGQVTFESAAYVARYVLKKVTGERSEKYYDGRTREYLTMSRRPGIGSNWFEKYKDDIYPSDEMVINGFPSKPSRFYDERYKKCNPEGYIKLKEDRKKNGKKLILDFVNGREVLVSNSDSYRLGIREEVKLAQVGRLKRSLEELGL